LFLGLLLSGHSARFLGTNPSQTNPFRLTNQALNVPSTTLTASEQRYYRVKGLKETPYEQECLKRKLNTLDARLLFSTLGPDAFLGCSWCRPSSSKASGSDHLYFVLSRLVLEYACLLLAIGLMATGASQPETKRHLWRGQLALMNVLFFILEASLLSLLIATINRGRNCFGKRIESQAILASSTAAIQTMKDEVGLSASEKRNHVARYHLRNWIDHVYPDPSSASSPSFPNLCDISPSVLF